MSDNWATTLEALGDAHPDLRGTWLLIGSRAAVKYDRNIRPLSCQATADWDFVASAATALAWLRTVQGEIEVHDRPAGTNCRFISVTARVAGLVIEIEVCDALPSSQLLLKEAKRAKLDTLQLPLPSMAGKAFVANLAMLVALKQSHVCFPFGWRKNAPDLARLFLNLGDQKKDEISEAEDEDTDGAAILAERKRLDEFAAQFFQIRFDETLALRGGDNRLLELSIDVEWDGVSRGQFLAWRPEVQQAHCKQFIARLAAEKYLPIIEQEVQLQREISRRSYDNAMEEMVLKHSRGWVLRYLIDNGLPLLGSFTEPLAPFRPAQPSQAAQSAPAASAMFPSTISVAPLSIANPAQASLFGWDWALVCQVLRLLPTETLLYLRQSSTHAASALATGYNKQFSVSSLWRQLYLLNWPSVTTSPLPVEITKLHRPTDSIWVKRYCQRNSAWQEHLTARIPALGAWILPRVTAYPHSITSIATFLKEVESNTDATWDRAIVDPKVPLEDGPDKEDLPEKDSKAVDPPPFEVSWLLENSFVVGRSVEKTVNARSETGFQDEITTVKLIFFNFALEAQTLTIVCSVDIAGYTPGDSKAGYITCQTINWRLHPSKASFSVSERTDHNDQEQGARFIEELLGGRCKYQHPFKGHAALAFLLHLVPIPTFRNFLHQVSYYHKYYYNY